MYQIFVGVETVAQLILVVGEGFVSNICRSRDGSPAYTGGGEGFVSNICRSRDGSPAYTGGGEGYSFPKIDPGIP